MDRNLNSILLFGSFLIIPFTIIFMSSLLGKYGLEKESSMAISFLAIFLIPVAGIIFYLWRTFK